MKHRYILLLIGTMILIIGLVSGYKLVGGKIINGSDYTKMTIYKNWDKEGPFVITDKKVINDIIEKINSAPKEDISKINFEKGPDGRILFEGKKAVYEVNVFSDGGNVVTKKYYLNTEIKLDKIIDLNDY